MRIRKTGCIKLDMTHYCTEEFNVALSLDGVLEIAFYFSEDFSEVATTAFKSGYSLLLRTEVQLVVSYSTIEV